jgi:ankyrin repeat protein
MSTLDNLRKAARRWLKALHAQDPDARARLLRAHPKAPPDPTLRDVQFALARERGFDGWIALKASVGTSSPPIAPPPADRVADFLARACWDHHTHGRGDYEMRHRDAARLLVRHPEMAHDSLYAATVCGDLDEVTRIVADDPAAARRNGGPRGWPPILYLCYARVPVPPAQDNALAIARMLLDHGADPNAYYMAGDSEYTALVGVAGEGEQDAPPHPHREALFALLLERGANPYDIQVLYNTHFNGDVLWWLSLSYGHALKSGSLEPWQDPNWSMLDMGGYGPGAWYLFTVAVRHHDMRLAEWLLAHGASPNAHVSPHRRFRPGHTILAEARRRGQAEMAALLERHGAVEATLAESEDEARFGALFAAAFRMDRDGVAAIVARHPEYLRRHEVLFEAARQDRVDVIEVLLDFGVPLEIEDNSGSRALHAAASGDARRAAALIIGRGAEIDPRERRYNNTPLGWAAHFNHTGMIDLLSRHSRDPWNLALRGRVERLREILAAEPALARSVSRNGLTPLWWLPADETVAVEVVELLLERGADPSVRAADGSTAADYARKRGLEEAARRLAVFGEPAAPSSPDLASYDAVAHDLVVAFEVGDAAALARLQEHFHRPFAWEELREGVRHRLSMVRRSERPQGMFALPHARLLIARDAGFNDWLALAAAARGGLPTSPPSGTPPPDPGIIPRGMIRPVEMRQPYPVRFKDGSGSTTVAVWDVLVAAAAGDLARVREAVEACPALVLAAYNYMPPLHLAVREGHVELVRFLIDRGAGNPNHVTYPYRETLVTVARDRGYDTIVRMLEDAYATGDRSRPEEEGGDTDFGRDDESIRFQSLVADNGLVAAEAMLEQRPGLARDELAFWGEGILSMPANRGHREMLELLMRFGATVPAVSKWGAWYFLKRADIAAVLLDRGMDANHMNCHHTTVLHDMAYTGDVAKARLLLDHGADIDMVDEEFRSTALGFAARWGQLEMVKFLIARGADPNRAGADWAAPREWARAKGHREVAAVIAAVA